MLLGHCRFLALQFTLEIKLKIDLIHCFKLKFSDKKKSSKKVLYKLKFAELLFLYSVVHQSFCGMRRDFCIKPISSNAYV